MKKLTVVLSLAMMIAPIEFCFAQNDLAALKQKAAAGDPAAQVKVGMSYALAVPRDVREAMRWFRLAADQGYADGQYRLGGMYDVAQSPQNPTEAIRWYRSEERRVGKECLE